MLTRYVYSRCHCISKSLNIPQWALPFHHAASSTSRLYNHCFPSNNSHSQSVRPHWAEAVLWENRYGRVGAGELGVAGDMSFCTAYPHSENLWCPAVSDVDCIAQICCKSGGIRVEIQWWANEASDSTSLRESNPGERGCFEFSNIWSAKFPLLDVIWKDLFHDFHLIFFCPIITWTKRRWWMCIAWGEGRVILKLILTD